MHPKIAAAADRLVLIVPANPGALLLAAAALHTVPNVQLAIAMGGWTELEPKNWDPGRAVVILAPAELELPPATFASREHFVTNSTLPKLLHQLVAAGHELIAVVDGHDALSTLDEHGKGAGIDLESLSLISSLTINERGVVTGSRMESLVGAFGMFTSGEYQSLLTEAALYGGGVTGPRTRALHEVSFSGVDSTFLEGMVRRMAIGAPPLDADAVDTLKALQQQERDDALRLAQMAEPLAIEGDLASVWVLDSEAGLRLPNGRVLTASELRSVLEKSRGAVVVALIHYVSCFWNVSTYGALREFVEAATDAEFNSIIGSLPRTVIQQSRTLIAHDLDTAKQIATLLIGRAKK